MHVIDLTHPFTASMPVFPGDPEAKLSCICDFQNGHGYSMFAVSTGMHTGTHMDAPLHMVPGGVRLSDIPPDRFFGRGVLIDARGRDLVDIALLKGIKLRRGDVVLVLTGFSEQFGKPGYFRDYPVITEAFAEVLVRAGVSALGLDTPSPDRDPYAVHKLLLGNGVLIIENLTNLEALVGKRILEVIALPAKFEADAAPVRVVAKIFDKRGSEARSSSARGRSPRASTR
ncbi:cyclase family protein [Verrucomicrobiota bacterium sgz303538]